MRRLLLPLALVPWCSSMAAAPVQERAAEAAGPERHGRWLGTLDGLLEPSAVAVDARGRVFVAEAAADRVRVFDAQGTELGVYGTGEEAAGGLLAPSGLALAPDGALFVADGGHHRVVRFDAEGHLVASFGGWGTGDGRLNDPQGLALDGERLYVADSRNHRVAVFGLDGAWIGAFGGHGRAEGRFDRPRGLAVDDDGALYVTDTGNHRVQKLDREGRCLSTWGDFGPYPGFFAEPVGIAWHAGEVHVADRDNHRIQVFGDEGELLHDWGVHALLPREGDGKVHYPDQLALSPDGELLALGESFEDRVQLFGRWPPGGAPEPDPLRFERDQSSHYGGGVSIGAGYMALVEPGAPSLILWDLSLDEPIQVCRHRRWGRGVGQLARPSDAAIDPARCLVHVADPGNRRLATYAFTPRGPDEPLKYDPFLLRLVREVDLDALAASLSSREGPPIVPEALTLAPSGTLYVLDPASLRIGRFGPDLSFEGFVQGLELASLADLAFDPTGRTMLVADPLGRRVVAARRAGEGEAWEAAFSVGGPQEERGGLRRPSGVAVLADGRVWVSDVARHRIVELAPQGELLRTIGGPGLRRVEFHKPRGIAQDGRGRVFVLDWGNHRGQVLTAQGEYLDSFGARFFTRPARLQTDAPQAQAPPPAGAARPACEPPRAREAALPPGPWDGAERIASNGGGYLVALRVEPDPVPENEAFALSAWVFDAGRPEAPLADVALAVDADMPEHGHGMTRVPEVRRRADGGFDASGLLFHMIGRWELYLDVTRGPITERAQRPVVLE